LIVEIGSKWLLLRSLSLSPFIPSDFPPSPSPTLPPSPGAAAQKLELTEKGIMNIVDENREEAERVEQEIRLNITTMRADIQVALFDLSSFTNFVS
jgi:hypothetical protein